MIHIPFDHIKTLPDGNYGCTLKVGGKSYCAIYAADWNIIEPLHEVEQDPYCDYTYIRDKDFAVASSYLYNGELHQIDPQLLYVLGIGNHELGSFSDEAKHAWRDAHWAEDLQRAYDAGRKMAEQ